MFIYSSAIHPTARERIWRLGNVLMEMGRKNNTLRDDISVEDLYIALIGIPMQYLASQYKFDFEDKTEDDAKLIDTVVAISLCAIQ